jgi:hypothetical protein
MLPACKHAYVHMRIMVPDCHCCALAGIRLSTFDTAKKVLAASEAALEQELAKED